MPLNGTAYSTNFTFNITKAKNLSALNFTECNFGYVDTKLNEYVILNTDLYIKNPSAANESYITVLPATSANTLTVFAQCMDINGLVTYFNKTITLVNQTVNVTIASEAALNKTLNSTTMFLPVPQIILFGNELLNNQAYFKNYTITTGYQKILDSISKVYATNLTSTDIDQLTRILTTIVNYIATN
jgi:hypothetical protein